MLRAARFICVLKFPVHLLVGVSINLNCEGVRHATVTVDAANETKNGLYLSTLSCSVSRQILNNHFALGMRSGESLFSVKESFVVA